MSRVRLHWFWRAAIATVVSCTYAFLSLAAFERTCSHVADIVDELLGSLTGFSPSPYAVCVVWFLPTVLIAVATYAVFTRYLGPRILPDGETRCRKCGYILRGITETRCPECGERI